MTALARAFRRGVGGALVLLVVLPVFRSLAGHDIGIVGTDILGSAERARDMLFYGTLVVLLVAVLLARVLDLSVMERLATRAARALTALPVVRFASVLAVLSFLATATFAMLVLHGKPNLIDAMAQLTHARYLAAGRIAGPVGIWSPFITIQNMLMLPTGWVSQYPPGHVALLAVGFALHAVWLVGPVLMAATAFFTALAADRLLPEDRGVARLGALLVAVNPFLIGLAGAYMNHISAAAGLSAAMYCAARSRDDESWLWSVGTGVALGFVFTVRPVAAITGGIAVTGVWLWAEGAGVELRARGNRVMRQLATAFVGAVPFGVTMAVYNAHQFGNPFRFGYVAADGPAINLGFHTDPWGHWYGPLEALAYTSSDLTALSLNLLETPIPAVIVCGLFLLVARRCSPGVRTIATWAIAPVVAGALYWHHGIFMGPRMLNEVAPAWTLLTVVSAVGLVRAIPQRYELGPYSLRGVAAMVAALGGVAGLLYLAPQRLASYGGPYMASTRIAPPQTTTPSLVFVHGSWTGRLASRLMGVGMRLDSVETALRENPTCVVDAFAKAYPSASPDERRSLLQQLTFTPDAGRTLTNVDASEGDVIRARRGEQLTSSCTREFLADRLGIVDIAPLVWQGDLPGFPAHGAMVVRDLGPEMNRVLMRAFPGRHALFLYRPSSQVAPVLTEYDAGVAAVWGEPLPNGR